MKYSSFHGEKISRLGFGTLRLPERKDGRLDYEKIEKMVDAALKAGINYFDTAYSYGGGEAERAVGKALRRHTGRPYFLADKIPTWKCKTPESVTEIFEEQLQKCGAEHFDFYLIHSVKDHRYQDIERLRLMEFMEGEQKRGRIRFAGASCHCGPAALRTLLETYGENLDFIQLQLNYMDWVAFDGKELYEIAKEYGKAIFVMEPLRGGMLAYPPSRAVREKLEKTETKASYVSLGLRFVDQLEQVQVTLSGVSDLEQLQENIEIFRQGPLTPSENEAVLAAARQLAKEILIPCTGCDYCSGCPKKIPISSVFKLYNEAAAMGFHCPWTSLSAKYKELHANGADCIACGKCEFHSPQNIPIIEELKKIDARYRELEKTGE